MTTRGESGKIGARDESGAPVDWWFIYKLPADIGSPETSGYEYLYFDASSTKLEKSSRLLNVAAKPSALDSTLKQIFTPSKGSVSWILYDDEHPQPGRDEGTKGHCKGILAFDPSSNTALLLIHSTPRFPARGEKTLPEDERIYGQTYLCITLKDYSTANQLAEQLLLQQDPQVYDHFLDADVPDTDAVARLSRGDSQPTPTKPSTLSFESRAGKKFQLIAKNRHWGGDFWIDLVAPELGVEMKVESWRRGTVPAEEKPTDPEEIEDTLGITLCALGYPDLAWKYTKDHAKWGISAEARSPWVCVGDLNRMVSQEKRGGGTAAFLEPHLWAALDSIEGKLETPDD